MTNVEEKLNASREFLNVADNQIKHLSAKLSDLMLDALMSRKDEFESIIKSCNELDKLISDEMRTYNQMRLLNDIRLGKIIPVRADTRTPVLVTFD